MIEEQAFICILSIFSMILIVICLYQQYIISKRDSEIATWVSRAFGWKKRYDKLSDVIANHMAKSHGQDRCWQNDLDLYKEAGIPFAFKYWPPVCEMYKECRNYIIKNHPDYNGELDAKNKK